MDNELTLKYMYEGFAKLRTTSSVYGAFHCIWEMITMWLQKVEQILEMIVLDFSNDFGRVWSWNQCVSMGNPSLFIEVRSSGSTFLREEWAFPLLWVGTTWPWFLTSSCGSGAGISNSNCFEQLFDVHLFVCENR